MNTENFQNNLTSIAAFLWLVLLIFSAPTDAVAATTYYVDRNNSQASDSNAGSQSQPWKTIGKAASAMVAGDTAIVVAGTYNEKVTTARSGAAGSRITFKANGTVATRTFNVSHNYVTIDGFEMTGANDGFMMTWSGSFGELLNNTIHDTGASWGIVRGDGDNLAIRGNRYYSSTGPSNDLPVFIVSGDNQIVENNEIGPAKDIDAFRAWGTNNIIRNNYIHDITMSSGSSAHMDVIQTFGGGSNNIVFEKNLINNSNGGYFQMFMTENNGASNTGNWDIRNNVYIGVSGQANLGIPNIRFYNNTIYNGGSSNKLIMYLYDASGKSNYSGARIKNNIFIPASSINSYGQVISVGSTGSNIQVSNNYIARIGTWGTVSGFNDPQGMNGGDPRLVNAGANDFHLQSNSPALDKGTTLTGFDNDYEGTGRPQGSAWDIGAFEFAGGSSASPLAPPQNLKVQIQ